MGDAEWASLDLNQASAEELTVLPGVGIKKAHKIVQYREEQRHKLRRHKKASKTVFKSAADLEQVPLTESLARRIADLLHLEAECTAGGSAESCPPAKASEQAGDAVVPSTAKKGAHLVARKKKEKKKGGDVGDVATSGRESTGKKKKRGSEGEIDAAKEGSKPGVKKAPRSSAGGEPNSSVGAKKKPKSKKSSGADSGATKAPSAVAASVAASVVSDGSAPPIIKIASWNLKNLSLKTDLRHFSRVAICISCFDIVAVQEIKSLEVLDRLLADPSGELCEWAYVASERPVGTEKHLEYYAYFYKRSSGVRLLHTGLVQDEGGQLVRPPFAATFVCGVFDFTLLTVHVIYGTHAADRTREVQILADVVREVLRKNKKEKDVMLLGDFNTPPSHEAWKGLQLLGYTPVLFGEMVTTIAMHDRGNLYDNLWYNAAHTGRNFAARCGVQDVFSMFAVSKSDRKQISDLRAAVSDHKPIWAEFRTDVDEDEDVYGRLQNITLKDKKT